MFIFLISYQTNLPSSSHRRCRLHLIEVYFQSCPPLESLLHVFEKQLLLQLQWIVFTRISGADCSSIVMGINFSPSSLKSVQSKPSTGNNLGDCDILKQKPLETIKTCGSKNFLALTTSDFAPDVVDIRPFIIVQHGRRTESQVDL